MRYLYALWAVSVVLSALDLCAAEPAVGSDGGNFPAHSATTAARNDWDAKQLDLREQLRNELDLPAARLAPRSTLKSTHDSGEYRLERIELQTPFGRAPALVFVPRGHIGRGPAVLWHLPLAAENFVASYMAPKQCVVMVFDGVLRDASSGQAGETARVDQLALNYLMGREDVDPDRVAVAGYGTRSSRVRWLAALNERVAVAVLVNAPAADDDDAQLAGLIVPRPQFILTAKVEGEHTPNDERKFYSLYEASELLSVARYDDADSTATSWSAMEQAVEWLKQEL